MIELSASIEIAAPAPRVWEILVDLGRFSAWNPFIRRAAGSVELGGEVRVRVATRAGLLLPLAARVVRRDEGHELIWRGHVLSPRFASGEHAFVLEPTGDGRCRFVQRERFEGALPRLFGGVLERETRRGFDAMNAALAREAERATDAAPRADRAPRAAGRASAEVRPRGTSDASHSAWPRARRGC